ncbi:Protein FIP2 [Camellia lanceoleosa]|uniref:Protein FIP2 n=1 Tax=Camellia lanceoleosa TaxID=1840588 RepID=A0ACC0IP62_9ERIC|nr:Protein FIP2 [Camellia lanceoleosa]
MKREGDPVAEMVATIKGLGDRFMRMERMKMELAREVEAMQRDMEMKRTEMLLESQERIVEFFGKALLEKSNKKAKRMPTPKA